jgi:uncharacterized protein (TIGR00251 family)
MISATPDGAMLHIRVVPRASRSGVAGTRGDAILVRLNAPPVEGAANDELVSYLADLLDVPKRAVVIVSGERSRSKIVRVTGVDADTCRTRLASPRTS